MVLGSLGSVAFADSAEWVLWSASSAIDADSVLKNITDGDAGTTLTTKNLGTSTAWRIFVDMAPDGGEIAPYNKVKISMAKYNAMKIAVHTSDTVYTAVNKETTPPASDGVSSVKFKSYTSPEASVSFNPYYISLTGEEDYPSVITLNFEEKTDRFVCIEITTAYNSKSETSEYFGINNEISEIQISGSVPVNMELDSSSDKLSVPAPGEEDKEITFSAKVYDEDGGEILKPEYTDFALTLDSDYPGITLDGNTLKISSEAEACSLNVTANLTASGFENISASKEITLLPADMTPYLVAEAAEKIDFSMISEQRINSVSRNLSLFYAEDGALVIGDTTYDGFEIAWESNNESVISSIGEVIRPSSADATVTLTATVSAVNVDGNTVTAKKAFVITVKNQNEAADMVNVVKGGYGWTTGGWGDPTSMADGNMTTRWTLGNHSTTPGMPGAVITGSGEMEKYNKVIIYFYENTVNPMSTYSIAGYETMKPDPGQSSAQKVIPGSGMVQIVNYDETKPETIPDENGKVVVYLPETAESKYFVVTLGNSGTTNNSIGVFELEAYYATPFNAVLSDADFKYYIPMEGKADARFDLPELDLFDETGDLLRVKFENEFSLAASYRGVELTDGKIIISDDCTSDSIDLIYRSWDDEKTLLETTITVPVEPYTTEYYDCENAIAKYMDQIPEICEENINLPTEENGCTLKWTSSDETVLSSDGVLTRPVYPEDDVTVTLTCVATKNEYKVEKSLEFIVSSEMTDDQRVRTDADKIDLGITNTVTSDIKLPATGYYGSKITWSSSNRDAISSTGKYSRIKADSSSVKVILTATVSYNGTTVTKEFTVYAAANKQSGSSFGGGGGGGSVRANPVVLAPENPTPLTQAQLDASVFDDVSSDHWAKEYIEKLYERKIINGVTEKTFEPERTVTREEYVKLIVTAFDIVLKPGEIQFADVTPGAWYEDYVVAAYKAGIVNGVDETTFGIGREITRQDMAVILERALALKEYEFIGTSAQFGDSADIADYALSAVENLSKIEIISGDDKGNFNPNVSGTRAEAAKLLYSAMEKGGMFE